MTERWSIDGIILDTIDVQDSFAMAVAQHKIPYRRGALLENMGLDDRPIRIKCQFFEDRYAEHADFVRRMTTVGDRHMLEHPAFGTLYGQVSSCIIVYDDRKNAAEIDLTFIVEEDDADAVSFLPTTVGPQVEEQYTSAQEAQMQSFADGMEDSLGAEASEICGTDIDPEQSLLSQFTSASQAARDYLADVDAAIARCEATLGDTDIAASSFVNTIDYGSRLPGRLVEAMARAAERFCADKPDALSPRAWLANLEAAYEGFVALFRNDDFNARDQARMATASRYSLETAYQYGIDNDAAMTLKRLESEPQFDVLGTRTSTESAPAVMTINELDDTLAIARAMLQQCVDLDRSSPCWKKTAEILLRQVMEIRLQRHRLVPKTIETSTPLHIVCLRYGIPVGMADRVLSVNPAIRNPNRVSGEILTYA